MKCHKHLFSLLWVAAALMLFPSFASAQGIRASVTGRVTDPSGAIVLGAKVTITNTGTNETRVVQTNDAGEYTVPQIPPGDYSLTVERQGFKKTVQRFTLETGQDARADVALQAGAVTEQVEITAVTPVISSEDASLGNVVDQKKIVELPLNGRSYIQLALLQPNVFAPAQNSTLGFRGGFNVSGNSEIANNFILDGIDNNDETTNQPSHTPILDAVREFKVLTGTYSSEYGRQSGGQVIVTSKSGTNQFHGSAFEFHRNSVFDARNFFSRSCIKRDASGNCTSFKPSFRRNQFGGVIGGPILNDKLFFFGGWESQRRGQQEAGLAIVPTAAMRQGDFSGVANLFLRDPLKTGNCTAADKTACFDGNRIPQARWNSVGAGLLGLYPAPNATGSNNFTAGGTGKFNSDQFSVRMDRKWAKHDLFGAYQFADGIEFYPITNPLCSARDVPGFGCDELQRTQHVSLNWTWTISSRLINEARIGYSRFGFFRLQED
ncbi:MAG: carboxypeptidase regulatory-like domain-containing protein, partial [Blastocatellia bacterium]